MENSQSIIIFSHVKKTLGNRKILDDLSFAVNRGKINFIVGRSGEGKSVSLKHILGLCQPDEGAVYVEGRSVGNLSRKELFEMRRDIGVLFQNAALFDHLTVEENILFPMEQQGRLIWTQEEKSSKLNELLEILQLNSLRSRFPEQLATGEKKRVGLARALAMGPKLLIYDEPTTGLDPLLAEMVDDLILSTNGLHPQMTSLVVSHDLAAALNLADHIIMLYQGKAVFEGSPADFQETQNPIVRQFFAGRPQSTMEMT